jgi:Leucine-rich repeat (LRR) protein
MSLELAGNQLQAFPIGICALPKLTELDLSSNTLLDIPVRFFVN